MIVGEQKPLEEIFRMLSGHERILVAGCRSCVAVCHAGGEKEVSILAEALRLRASLANHPWKVEEITVERQCEREWVEAMGPLVKGKDAVLSLACGVGAQTVQVLYPRIRVLPGLNTSHMGAPDMPGVFVEKCGGCGDCLLHLTGGICPIARCAKSLLNGPCGGSQNGRCEISPEVPCAWDQIVRSLEAMGRSDLLEEPIPPKSWLTARDGGPRRTVIPTAVISEEQRKMKGERP
ncbi:MAG: methylenetetrahydrofolate reductase C-terminal domain-containing protein [Methanomassiliicoccales archaeon]